MRHVAFLSLLFGAVVLGSACGVDGPEPAADGGGGSVPEGGAAPTPCEEAAGDCAQCVVCANTDPCEELRTTCENTAGCAQLQECVSICADDTCKNMCMTMHGTGIAAWEAWATCAFCEICPNECEPPQQTIACQ